MPIDKDDIIVERTTGKKKAGGANRNCVNSAIRLTHKPTGIQVRMDGRDSNRNLQMALKELERRLEAAKQKKEATVRKDRRDAAIKDETVVRTYNVPRGIVKDHRTGKEASIKDVLVKGKIELVSPSHSVTFFSAYLAEPKRKKPPKLLAWTASSESEPSHLLPDWSIGRRGPNVNAATTTRPELAGIGDSVAPGVA